MEKMDDKQRARLVGWADAQVNGFNTDQLLAMHVAAGTAVLRRNGIDDEDAIHAGKKATSAIVGLLLAQD